MNKRILKAAQIDEATTAKADPEDSTGRPVKNDAETSISKQGHSWQWIANWQSRNHYRRRQQNPNGGEIING